MASPRPHFPPATLTFLRALARNNDREWFRARNERYEQDVRGPMIAVVAQLLYFGTREEATAFLEDRPLLSGFASGARPYSAGYDIRDTAKQLLGLYRELTCI